MKYSFLIGFLALTLGLRAQEYQLDWKIETSQVETRTSSLTFDGASISACGLPLYSGLFELPTNGKATLELFAPQYQALTPDELYAIRDFVGCVPSTFEIDQTNTSKQGADYVSFGIQTIRVNPESGDYEKLMAFDLMPIITQFGSESHKTSNWAEHSVLATGNWIRVPISKSGFYYISVQTLISKGIISGNEPTSHLLGYHNGGGMLPERISVDRHDDLAQIALRIDDGGDGVLNGSDKVYFYAEGPDQVSYSASNNRLQHAHNVYARETYVYFTYNDQQNGLRVTEYARPSGTASITSTGFDELQFHELDQRNIAGTGREWYGEVFDFTLSRNYSFNFPNRIVDSEVQVALKAAATASRSGTRFELEENGVQVLYNSMAVSAGETVFQTNVTRTSFITSSSSSLDFTLDYNRAVSPTATGYLDYLAVQARRSWSYANGGFVARDLESIASGQLISYTVSNTDAWVWDVTNPIRPFAPERNANGEWLAPGDSLRTYLVAKASDATEVTATQSVDNQDLHGLRGVDMLIVSHPNFLSEANRLAAHHVQVDGLNVEVVTPQEIYHEFSAGAQDITAIRDFARMLYKRDTADPLEFLLLFGDASYDYLDRVSNKQNFVPIYESPNSTSLYTSFMTDDYFSCLDDGEGANVVRELLDINTGRLPVKTTSEAKAVVDKIITYAVAENSFGEWRNQICFVSDDVDESWETILTTDPENVAQRIDTVYPTFNIEKVYSDSYTQESTSGSQSYPGARDALYRSVDRGNLITAYTGHGGEVGWSSERLLQLSDINSWSNAEHLPLFVTITCEFTRLDDPMRTSAGEQVLLNPNGGGIGLISTTRVVFVQGAIQLNRAVFNTILEREQGEYSTLGDIVRRAKNEVSDGDRVRFSLVGDPALRLNIPVHEVVLDSINNIETALVDTVKARETVTLEGRVMRDGGGLFSDFNGEVVVTIYDKAVEQQTKRNDNVGQVVNFMQQENIIFKGRASVVNGYWNIEFVVPRDINYTYGQGKISLYAQNGVTDARGVNKTFYVGGLGDAVVNDDEGPEIRLFMNDTNFISGGLTDENPLGLALLYDESGINVVGNGLGHDVIGVLDNDFANSFKLNAYYKGDLDTYQSGVIEYPFYNLSNGQHQLLVRVWDVMNNVAEATVNFVVAEREELVIQDLFNYPNPFSETTTFSFEHNRPDEELQIDLFITDMSGRIVNQQSQVLTPGGTRTLNMTWDGTGGRGAKVSSGLYVFRLVVRSKADGSEAEQSERLVYLK